MELEEVSVKYILVYPRGDKTKITVVDCQYYWQYNEYSRVTPKVYDLRDEAILEARRLAEKYQREYIMFESRYGGPAEYLGEFE
jgi:hypothetical protein